MTPLRDLRALPTAHLHVHLEGAMRPGTLAELARERGVPAHARPEGTYTSFTAFLDLYTAACAVLTTEDDLRRLVREVVEDAAADGAVWVEPQANPHRHPQLGPAAHVLDVVLDEAARAAAATGTGVGLVVTCDRNADPGLALELAELAAARSEAAAPPPGAARVVGLGLAKDESTGPPEPFAPAFALAREAGLLSVPHAGELAGPGSVRGALDALGADRLAHGVRVLEDRELLARVVAEGIVLDVCPTSNAALGVVGAIGDHPLPALLAAGARCTVNADDPLLFGVGLAEELALCREVLGLGDAALAACAATSLEASGAPRALVATGLARIGAWLAA